jgi:hypothetical protein
MDERMLKQLFAELINANEQALAVLCSAISDVTDPQAFASALENRITSAQDAAGHPNMLLKTVLQAAKARATGR